VDVLAALADAPCAGLPARLVQDPLAELVDQARLLSQRDEVGGRDQALPGMLPANERLESDHRSVCEIHDRLVVENELPALDGPSEVGLQIEAATRGCRQVGVEQLAAPAAPTLGGPHRQLRLLQHAAGVQPRLAKGDAD